jgi:hypothetical protein
VHFYQSCRRQCVPKRKIKEDKPRKKMGRKQILIPPVIVGVATLSGFLIIQFFPAPSPVQVCLRSHSDTFNVHSRIDLEVNGHKKLLPDTLGQTKAGKECLRVIHTDSIGDQIHVQFVRPVRLTLGDFMKVYTNNSTSIQVVDNSTGKDIFQNLTLADYNIEYSYFSDGGFVKIANLTNSPPLSNTFLGKITMNSK